VLVGSKEGCYEYVARLRRLKWASMELRGEWTAAWRETSSDGGGGGGGCGGVSDGGVIDGDVLCCTNPGDDDYSGGRGGVFFRELSTNARGAAEAESLCSAAGLGHVWDATVSRSGKGAAVSAALRWGCCYSCWVNTVEFAFQRVKSLPFDGSIFYLSKRHVPF
jgi:hypothetical protein